MHEVLIVGGGPVGLSLALALQPLGLPIAIVDARERGAGARDPRILALSDGSRVTLQRLGVWSTIEASPIRRIRVSQHEGFGRTMIDAADHGLPALGHVVAAGALSAALDAAVARAGIAYIERSRVASVAPGRDEVVVSLEGERPGACRARLVACAEGGVRDDQGAVSVRDYGQHALLALATPREPHQGLAHEHFTAHGPLALLPFGRRYAIVHCASAAETERLQQIDAAAYLDGLEDALRGRVRFDALGERVRFPLMLRYRRNPVGARTVWLGNAAQTLHPVAGQGFNLALRDVSALARRLSAGGPGGDPGDPALLAGYRRARRLDRNATIGATDALVRLFGLAAPPLAGLRGLGLLTLDLCAPLRGWLTRRMMYGARAWP